jgi:hypothetical protein
MFARTSTLSDAALFASASVAAGRVITHALMRRCGVGCITPTLVPMGGVGWPQGSRRCEGIVSRPVRNVSLSASIASRAPLPRLHYAVLSAQPNLSLKGTPRRQRLRAVRSAPLSFVR